MEKTYLTMREAAEYIGLSYNTIKRRKRWMNWQKFGVDAYCPAGKIIFKRTDLDRMVESSRVEEGF